MGKGERKTRLNKASASASGDFIGFSAFASSSPTVAAVSPPAADASGKVGPPANATSAVRAAPSPVFNGTDPRLQQLFRRIGQKKDATTRVRALAEVRYYAFTSGDAAPSRPERVEALSHLVYLSITKLLWDNAPSVRAEAIQAILSARDCVPRAWRGLVVFSHGALVLPRLPSTSVLALCHAATLDPSSEVSLAAAAVIRCAQEDIGKEAESTSTTDHTLQKTVLNSSIELLSIGGSAGGLDAALYGRTKAAVADALLGNVGSGGGDKGKKRQQQEHCAPPSSLEEEREESEERYERAVMAALDGVSALIDASPEPRNNHRWSYADLLNIGEAKSPAAALWRHLMSLRSPFRRSTYALLSVMAQHSPSLLHNTASSSGSTSKLSNLIPSVISTEKDPGNMRQMLDFVLSYVASFDGGMVVAWDVDLVGIDPDRTVSALSKLFRRACHGSPASRWTPIVLPLVACLPGSHVRVLASIWEGHHYTINGADEAAVATATAETAAFLLLRRQPNNLNEDNSLISGGKDIAKYFLNVLHYYLSQEEKGGKGISGSSEKSLCGLRSALLRDLSRLEKGSDEESGRENCALFHIREWFWSTDGVRGVISEKASADEGPDIQRLSELVGLAAKANSKDDNTKTRLHPTLRECVLPVIVDSASVPPTGARMNLLLEVMRYCGVLYVLDGGGVEPFIAVTLAKWMVTLFSSSALDPTNSPDSNTFVDILSLCFQAVGKNERRRTWEAFLRQMVEGNIDLAVFSRSLLAIADLDDSGIISCKVLNDFAVELGEAIVLLPADASFQECRSIREVLHTLTGGTARYLKVMVDRSVVKRWVSLVCPIGNRLDMTLSPGYHILLEVLVVLAGKDLTAFDRSDISRLLLQSWKVNCRQAFEYIAPGRSLYSFQDELIETAKAITRAELLKIVDRNEILSDIEANRLSNEWSKQSWRLFQLCSDQSPSLGLVGLDNPILWTSFSKYVPSRIYVCLLNFMNNINDFSKRRYLVCGDVNDDASARVDLFVAALLSLVDSSTTVALESNLDRHPLMFDFYDLVESLPRQYVLSLCKTVVDIASSTMKKGSSAGDGIDNTLSMPSRAVAVLDFLSEKLFGRRCPTEEDGGGNDEVAANEIIEGGTFFYETNKGSDQNLVKAKVEKIHSDDYPHLYFTISIHGKDGKTTERQTTAARLKKYSREMTKQAYRSNEHEIEASTMTSTIFDCVVRPFLSAPGDVCENSIVAESAAEFCSIAISRSGVGKLAGIGSMRYDIYSITSKLDSTVREAMFSSESIQGVSPLLHRLSLVLGFGRFAEPSPGNMSILNISTAPLIAAIHSLVNDNEMLAKVNNETDLFVSIITFLTVALSPDSDSEALLKAMSILAITMTKLLLPDCPSDHFILATKAFQHVQKCAHNCLDYSDADTEAEPKAFCALIRRFAKGPPENKSDLRFFSSLIMYNLSAPTGSWIAGTRIFIESLCETLSSSSKLQCTLQLLLYLARQKEEVYANFRISSGTQKRLVDRWKRNLDNEEGNELENDVAISSKWLPGNLMEEMEAWKESERDQDAMTLLLKWIITLEFLDGAASADMKNRASLTSYLNQTGAVGEALSLALSYACLNFRDTSWMACLDLNQSFSRNSHLDLTEVATIVVFRTIESVPTLAKKWISDDCPRSMGSSLSDFVEKMVAPETLRRDLSRIEGLTNIFGEMSVTGSCVSREVAATYVQDESTLSVIIKIPPTFPLRNAEVDCKKTLGIPENRWRRWALQISRMLNFEDGSIIDALMLWKENVEKEYDGVEPCPVCYSVLCVKTHTMPNLECKTCQNRFHSNCLYKWFQSSGKSQCVICQQPWSGTKVA